MSKAPPSLITTKLNGEKLVAFDVGAKGGVFSLPKLQPYLKFYGFEPNPEAFAALQKHQDNTTYFPYALAGQKGTRDLNITQHSSYASFLKLDEVNFEKHFGRMKDYPIWKAGMEIVKVLPVETTTLDDLCEQEKIKTIDFLKLDTQGTELEILQGGEQALKDKKIGVIFVEFSFIKSYAQQNLFSELELYLRNLDYELIDCRFYPDTVQERNSPFKGKIYDPARYSVGGDAVFVPRIEEAELDEVTLFKIGLTLAELRYIGIAGKFLKKSGLSDEEIQVLFKNFQRFSLKKFVLSFIPPVLYPVIRLLLSSNKK